jgi:type I restriction enzyme, S subunit
LNHWESIKIEDIATKVGSGSTPRGGSESYKESGIPLIRSMNIHFDGIHYEGLAHIDNEQADSLKNVEVFTDDVLLNITGASIGRVTQAPKEMNGARVNQHVCIIRPKKELNPTFLSKYLASPSVQRIIMSEEYGVTRQALTKQAILNFEIPLPPLNEQRRIVSTIEQLTDRSHKARAALEDVPKLIAQFRQSVLAAAFRGDLTADWRENNPDIEPASELLERIKIEQCGKKGAFYKKLKTFDFDDKEILPKGWCWSTFAQVSERVTVGHVGSMKNEYTENGIPFLRSQNVRENYFEAAGLIYISQEFHEKLEKSRLSPGDIIVVRSGSVGVSCVVPDSLADANCSDLIIVKQPKGINPFFGAYYMNSVARSDVDKNRVGIALTHFNTKSMAEMLVPVPPMLEQEEIIRQIKACFSLIILVEDKRLEITDSLVTLDRSILAKAFRGELVPQDPNDEPAAVLLERIRAEREQTSSNKQRGKTTRKNSSKQLSIEGIE